MTQNGTDGYNSKVPKKCWKWYTAGLVKSCCARRTQSRYADDCTVANRFSHSSDYRSISIGFRLARSSGN